jgi:ubiquitin-conjugating enzyme E2 D/E
MARARITRDLKLLAESPLPGVSVQPLNDNLFTLRATFEGPPDTPYAGGTFVVDVTFPTNFPLVGPTERKFVTRIYHPNVTDEGLLCKIENWKPSETVSSVLQDTYGLLEAPNLEIPLNTTIAEQYKSDLEAFKRTAAQWTRQYAQS